MRKVHLLLIAVLFSSAMAYGQQAVITLHGDESKYSINKNIYGHFAEHLGHCIYDGIYIGDTNKLIPNTEGVRNDVIAALKKLKVPVIRWPGGCFADTYHWKDGVGPKKDRPAMVNKWWGGVTEDNSFGTHDFLNMCERVGADPYLTCNVGSGTVQDVSQWIEYVNFAGKSPMSDWRRANGRDKPWQVKYFGVGNEAWGCGGSMTPEYYANEYRKYATFMTDYTNGGLYRIASGANADDYHWTEVLMRDIPRDMLEGIALHYYSIIDWGGKGPAVNFTREQYFTILKNALRMEELVTRHSTVMDKYDPEKKVGLVVDEWGGWYDVEPGTNPAFLFQQNTMRDAMIAGVTLNIFNNHCDRVRMANLAQMVNVLQAVILTDKEKIILTPTYHVMEMYNVHQGAEQIPVTVSNINYVQGKDTLPAISASASKDKNGVTHLSLVNIDPDKTNMVVVRFSGTVYRKVSGRILASSSVQDHNSFDDPDKVKPVSFAGAELRDNVLQVKLPPASVVVLALN
ncbi:MAG: alpha-L-arabinofuranosidase C-terminal domain-containing protein [Bacteroidota bacterium]|nr:alpha-L-arabinofuranosidase C-terminal domain-containing protein [Bacteroidota bacterium]